jgi:hypothetical protein
VDTNEKSGLPPISPDDIIDIDKRIIVRCFPTGNVGDFNPDDLPFIEFSEPDFLWRYTPKKLRYSDPEKLRPWILLVILEEEEFSWRKQSTKNEAPSIVVHSVAKSLPNLNCSYLSECVRIAGNDGKSSRILCPRKLEEKRKYHAFLVPIFKKRVFPDLEVGKEAGETLENAWKDNDQESIELPYYHHLQFSTGKKRGF